jgi:hypothetical protein
LTELGIDKTRASKARAIYRTFAQEDEVAGLTVEEAYARRRKKKGKEPADDVATPKPDVKGLRKSVGKIAQRTGAVIHDAAFAVPEEAVVLIPAVRNAIRQLEELLKFLEQQAAETSAGGNPKATGAQETVPTT